MALALRSKQALVVDNWDNHGFQVAPEMLDACRSVSLRIGGPQRSCIPVTSTLQGEGKTTIAVVLALIQATDYHRQVILLDADLENPSLADRFRLKPWPGLAELTRGRLSVEEALQPAGDGIRVITAGEPAVSPARLAMEVIASGVLRDIAGHGVVVADLPGLLTCGYAHGLADALVEPPVLVVRAGITPLPRVRQSTESLKVEPALLLNGTESSLPRWLRLTLGR